MSAIWGFINLDKNPIDQEIFDKMQKEYEDFKIDRFEYISNKNAAFGAAIQYFTKEAPNEVLPFYDELNDNLFTADCFLDNRDDLIEELNCIELNTKATLHINENTPDGMLIYLSYLAWGKDMCDHLLGVFSFAIYNYKTNSFYLFTDHVSDRCIHYYQKDNTIYFSTIISPIQAANNFNIQVSEKYITACESNMTADMVIFPGLTPFEGIYQLLAGCFLTADFTLGKVHYETIRYYDPVKNVKPLKLSDSEYKELFLKTYSKCVTGTLRSANKTGAFLSSGLDSSSVAALALAELKKKGESLYSYTSVPSKGYTQKDGLRLEDESSPVQEFCEHFDNIVPTFLSCEGKSALTEMEHLVNLLNTPLKYSINCVWIEEIYKQAALDGCRVILKGQHGNCTVSFGGLIPRIWSELTHFHFMEAIKQYRSFSHNFHVNRKMFLNAFFSDISAFIAPKYDFNHAISKTVLMKKYDIYNTVQKHGKLYGNENIFTEKQRRNSIYLTNSFQQISNGHVFFELENGLISRDPTKDKRMIELCMAMPIRCFSDGKYERRLISDFMKDIVPDVIIKHMYHRGIQSADYMYRLSNFSKDYSHIISSTLSDRFLDKSPSELFHPDSKDQIEVFTSLNVLSLLLFLNKNSN
ncbi:MAG: hypothetical protein K6A23_04130 [Butyrivibrio sp.]|nr:hypothetical protein [Butyrivibrio sp.]